MSAVQQVPPTPLHPLSVEGASSFEACGNCGTPMAGPFCSQCGERKFSAADYSIRTVVHEVAADFAHLDSKILRTLKALLTKPGLLSKVYFAGGRSRYTKPLTLFVILNIVFFIVQPHTRLLRYDYNQYLAEWSPGHERRRDFVRQKLIAKKETEPAYRIRFNARLQEQKKSMLIFSVPMLALAMAVVYARKKRFYVEHLVFATHVYAFLLISLIVVAGLLAAIFYTADSMFGHASHAFLKRIGSDNGLSIILGAALLTYIFLGLRRAYADSAFGAAIRAALLAFVVLMLTGYYHDLLFWVTYLTT